MTALTCPKCQAEMRSYERNGVTIDQCADCRGIFLDRGELERLIDAEAGYYEKQAREPEPPRQPEPRYQEPRYEERRYDERKYDTDEHKYYGGYRKKKRHSFLSELFD
ncbi:zf-TFIIB domain-containing protein [Sporichthya polymorpha]|uniref:TFIIB-type zinc ribbon-containing protein n=1 Tax=Sporichthya polymorpha TaxID=35751 RepID=UPI00035D48CF|nr:zf-TFIIB domain-containing protein [Sporichthya polymorpha]